jgi:hypothetical protein
MGMTGISKSQVSRLCGKIDDKVQTFLNRPLEGDWPYVWLDAIYVKVREAGRIVSVAVIIAVGVNGDGRREVLWPRYRPVASRDLLDRVPAQARPAWPAGRQARDLGCARGTEGRDHQGVACDLAALPRASHAQPPGPCRSPGPRCRRRLIATAFAQEGADAARTQWRQVAPKVAKLAALMDEVESDVLAYLSFPAPRRPKLHSTNPIERLNGEIKRRTEVVGILPNEQAITRLVGAFLLEQNDEWAVQRARYMRLETIAPLSDGPVKLPAVAG